MSIWFLLFSCHQILISMFFEVVSQAEFLHICYCLSFPMLERAGRLEQEG